MDSNQQQSAAVFNKVSSIAFSSLPYTTPTPTPTPLEYAPTIGADFLQNRFSLAFICNIIIPMLLPAL
jgi:hypothetical protein